MKKWVVITGAIFLAISALILSLAPDVFSLIIICVMCLVMTLGYVFGLLPAMNFTIGFRNAEKQIQQIMEVNTSSPWLALQQIPEFFQQKSLDALFAEYSEKVSRQMKNKKAASDIEDMINEESLALRSWQSVILQIPGTMTAFGILGTFLGLILGITGIAFSSVEAALSSITLLLNGIEAAFYTSIAGVIFSITFNISYRMIWNTMVRELGVFTESFHRYIIPYEEEQIKDRRDHQMEQILEYLERSPSGGCNFSPAMALFQNESSNEQKVMSEIWEALKKKDFIFYIQPRCNLESGKLVGGEALMRMNHEKMGIISPTIFLPMLEKNGYIVKIDRYIWEEVCRTIRGWMDQGIRPVPVAVHISKMDLLVMNVCDFFEEMIGKYQIPPQYLEIEIDEMAYLQCVEAVHEVEHRLRQRGFRVIVNGFKGDLTDMDLISNFEADGWKVDIPYLQQEMHMEHEDMEKLFEEGMKNRIQIVASGIENMRQMNMLRKLGCQEGQGYYLYKPLSIEDFEKMMEH
ncbi:MAG: EAL domain-containing protein [Clostridiales bacterium]|nr:EAL domain-containing protein [Candidatus Blautia equi]